LRICTTLKTVLSHFMLFFVHATLRNSASSTGRTPRRS
jgi:hypothetical protein